MRSFFDVKTISKSNYKNYMKTKTILFTFFLVALHTLQAQQNLVVTIDDRMEALSIFYTLATADTLDVKPTPSTYYKDVKTYFEPYKNHASLNWYRNLESWDGYDMASMGLFLSDTYPFTVKIKPEVKYIKSTSNDVFLQHFNTFYKECNVKKFIKEHQKQYQSVCKTVNDSVQSSGILKEINNFYGQSTDGKFIIYLDLLNNLGNNAIPSVDPLFKGKRMFRLAYLNDTAKNLTDNSPVQFTPYLNVVVHEISHLFLGSFIQKYDTELFAIRSLFLTTTKGETLKESEWKNESEELLVRVSTAKILAQKFGKEAGLKEIENQASHFKLAIPLYYFMETYSTNRNSFKTIRDFYPELLGFLQKNKL